MTKVYKRLKKCIALLLVMTMIAGSPVTGRDVSADEANDINITGILQSVVREEADGGKHWLIWLKSDVQLTDSASGYEASAEHLIIKSGDSTNNVVYPAYGIYKDASYVLLDIWGEYTKVNEPKKDDLLVVPTLTITNKTDNSTQKIAKRVIFKFDGSSWNLVDDVLNIESLDDFSDNKDSESPFWEFCFNVSGIWNTEGIYKAPDDYKVTIKNAAGNMLDEPKTSCLTWVRKGEKLGLQVWGEYTSKNQPNIGDIITIPSTKITNQENLLEENIGSEVTFKFNGTIWEKEATIGDVTGYTKVEISGFNNVYSNGDWMDETHKLYLTTSTALPGEPWKLFADVKLEINGKETTAQLNKYNDNSFYLPISGTDLPYGQDATIVIKAGKYIAQDGKGNESGKIYFEKDWTFYASKYGVSTKDSILDKNVTKVSVTLNTDSKGDAGYYLNADKEAAFEISWSNNIVPINNNLSTANTMYYYHGDNENNGFKIDGVKRSETMVLKYIGSKVFFVAIQDAFGVGNGLAGTYELCGAYCDESGNIVSFNPYEVTRVHNGESITYEENLNIDYTQFTLSEIYEPNGYNDTALAYHIYLKPSNDLPGEGDSGIYYNGLKIKIGDGEEKEISVFKAGHQNGSFFFPADENTLPKDIAAGTKITILKGKAISSDKKTGIELTEDYVMYAKGNAEGFTVDKPSEYTSFNITSFKNYTKYNADQHIWQMYVATDVTDLPGTAWNERFNIKVSIGDTVIDAEAMKGGSGGTGNMLYFVIPDSALPYGPDTVVTVKAGKYACNNPDVTIGYDITSDFKFYVSKHGCSTNDKILDKNVIKGGLVLGTEITNQSALYIKPTIDDGLTADFENWTVRMIAAISVDNDKDVKAVYFDNNNGLWIDGVHVKVDAEHGQPLPLVKLNEYYVGLGDAGVTAEDNKEYTIGGVFYSNVDGQLIEYTPITVKWDGTKWTKVSKSLTDTEVEADINADGVADVRDLIRLVHYHRTDKNPDVNEARLDVNKDNDYVKNKDSKDIISIRKILAGYVSYIESMEGVTAVTPSGSPSYNKENKVEVLAYSCPNAGTWDDGVFTVSPTLDADLKAYKDAGFTLLLSEFVGVLKDDALDEEHQVALVTYLKAAQRQGLGVIVASDYLFGLLKCEDSERFNETLSDGVTLKWKYVLREYVKFLKKYPAFKGFMMADELTIKYIDNYKNICEYLLELDPDINLHSSQLPVTGYENAGADALTNDTTTNNTKELAYKDYVQQFGLARGNFTYDIYPLIYKETGASFLQKKEYSVNSEWYDNLKWTADVIKNNRYAFTMGVTVQSCKIAGTDSIWSKYERYAPEQKSDIGFQVYTAMAYGTKEVNYFTYLDHPADTTVEEAINDNDKVREAVTAINKELSAFGYIYKSFNWKDTLDIKSGDNNTSTGNSRLASVSSNGGRVFVGCMKDDDGFDGYMVANAEGPRTSNNATVTMTFNNAKSVTVYKGEECTKVDITNGVYTASIKVGEGIFVIPSYN